MVFTCAQCGECCRTIGSEKYGKKTEGMYGGLLRSANAQGPIYYLFSWGGANVRFFEWEIPPLLEKAKELGVELRFKPRSGFYDDYGKTWGIMTWQIGHAACPLQGKDNRCRAYAQRANICGRFPFDTAFFGSFFEAAGKQSPDKMVSLGYSIDPDYQDCPGMREHLKTVKKQVRLGDCLKQMYEDYGEQFIWAYKGYRLRVLLFSHILEKLRSSKIVKAHTGPIPADRKRMVPAIQYLIELKILPPDYTEKLLAKVDLEAKRLEESLK